MNEKIRHVLERFPDESHRLSLLMAGNAEFLALCEDYDTCVNALQYWCASKEPDARDRVAEYRTLVRELEEEITETLETLRQKEQD